MSSSSALITPALRVAYRSARHAFSSHHSSTSSSAGGRMVTGTHLLRIESYPLLRNKVVTGKSISSAAFDVGGKEWRFHYYPNGFYRDTDAGSVCVALELTSMNPAPWDVVAEYKVGVIGRDGKPAWYGCDVPLCHFNSSTGGFLVARLRLLRWLAPWFVHDDDCLDVQCDVSVLELDTES